MIESVNISGIATYDSGLNELAPLKKINFIFGYNGAGKTTISRVIADKQRYPSCSLTWLRNSPLEVLVYNRDFVERNFSQSSEIRGIFTLGEKSITSLGEIEDKKNLLDRVTGKIQNLEAGLEKKNKELEELEDRIKNKCWLQKQKYDDRFSAAFSGFRGSKERFVQKVLEEREVNSEPLETLQRLEEKAATIFEKSISTETLLPVIDMTELAGCEKHPIFKKVIIGKEDIDISEMIQRLDNSDWVKEGVGFYAVNNGVCPFCQQKTTEEFSRCLSEYFDVTFEDDVSEVERLLAKYTAETERVRQSITSIGSSDSKHLEVEKFRSLSTTLEKIFESNLRFIEQKRRELSRMIELESTEKIIYAITTLLKKANEKIVTHNSTVANIAEEKKKLTGQIWNYLTEDELKDELKEYHESKSSIYKAVANFDKQIRETRKQAIQLDSEIKCLEKQTTSIQPTIDGINDLLKVFGTPSFSLGTAENGKGYKLVRQDGTDAHKTLSEGEQAFITFLYFFHLLKGSVSETGQTNDRVVVFDDPVSSLDSEALFIVGNLIKTLFNEIRNETGYIKQIIILTHNVYFHKEVTFNSKRGREALRDETFWIVRKTNSVSTIENYDENPVKSSYELLWNEIRRENRSNLSIQNTLRRALEHYFKILGGFDFDEICNNFEGQDKIVCKSLFSWTHYGSHYVGDDLYVSMDDHSTEIYLRVFRDIFQKTGHISHYNMMMKEDDFGSVPM